VGQRNGLIHPDLHGRWLGLGVTGRHLPGAQGVEGIGAEGAVGAGQLPIFSFTSDHAAVLRVLSHARQGLLPLQILPAPFCPAASGCRKVGVGTGLTQRPHDQFTASGPPLQTRSGPPTQVLQHRLRNHQSQAGIRSFESPGGENQRMTRWFVGTGGPICRLGCVVHMGS
jgi:hypothetical protein